MPTLDIKRDGTRAYPAPVSGGEYRFAASSTYYWQVPIVSTGGTATTARVEVSEIVSTPSIFPPIVVSAGSKSGCSVNGVANTVPTSAGIYLGIIPFVITAISENGSADSDSEMFNVRIVVAV